MAFKTNVVKANWRVSTIVKGTNYRRDYILSAESEEAAKLKVPEDEEIVRVERLDGDGG